MEHKEAISLMAAEKYLLGELPTEQRDSFEEHFFSCQECAADVRAAAAFLEHSKKLLAVQPAAEVITAPVPSKPGWLAWLRPSLALPVIALLAVVVLYQNVVTYPALKNNVAELRAPQILPSTSLISANSRGGSQPSISIHPGQPFLLFVDIAGDGRYSSYTASLQGPEGNREWSLTVPRQATRDTVSIRIPAGITKAGDYTLVVQGLTSSGEAAEVARYPFTLRLQ